MTGAHRIVALASAAAALAIVGCAPAGPTGTQIILLGDSFANGAEAVLEANNAVANAQRAGCKAISVGGYGAGAAVEGTGGLVIGVPVLVDCPTGTRLLPDGNPAP